MLSDEEEARTRPVRPLLLLASDRRPLPDRRRQCALVEIVEFAADRHAMRQPRHRHIRAMIIDPHQLISRLGVSSRGQYRIRSCGSLFRGDLYCNEAIYDALSVGML